MSATFVVYYYIVGFTTLALPFCGAVCGMELRGRLLFSNFAD